MHNKNEYTQCINYIFFTLTYATIVAHSVAYIYTINTHHVLLLFLSLCGFLVVHLPRMRLLYVHASHARIHSYGSVCVSVIVSCVLVFLYATFVCALALYVSVFISIFLFIKVVHRGKDHMHIYRIVLYGFKC